MPRTASPKRVRLGDPPPSAAGDTAVAERAASGGARQLVLAAVGVVSDLLRIGHGENRKW